MAMRTPHAVGARHGAMPMREPACRICGCTHFKPCNPPCSWVPVDQGKAPLCSTCLEFAEELAVFIDCSRISKAGLARLYDELAPKDRRGVRLPAKGACA